MSLPPSGLFSLKNLVKYPWIFSDGNFCFSLKGISVVENVYLNEIQIAVVSFLVGKMHVTF